MALNFDSIGQQMIEGLFAQENPANQVVMQLVEDKLKTNTKAYDRDSVLFVDELNQRIIDNPNADPETVAGWRRLIVKYSS